MALGFKYMILQNKSLISNMFEFISVRDTLIL